MSDKYTVDPGYKSSNEDHGGRRKCVEIVTIPKELWGRTGPEPYDPPRIKGHGSLWSDRATRLHLTDEEMAFYGVERLPYEEDEEVPFEQEVLDRKKLLKAHKDEAYEVCRKESIRLRREEGLTTKEIHARIQGAVRLRTVNGWLKDAGVGYSRSEAYARHTSQLKKNSYWEEVIRLRRDLDMTAKEIHEKIGGAVSVSMIYTWLRDAGFPSKEQLMRKRAESRERDGR